MKWYSYLLCCVLIIGGFFSAINMFDIWSRTSGVYGSPSSIETQNDYTVISKFDNGVFSFETDDYVNYEFTETYAPVDEFNGLTHDYALLFNDNLISDVEFYAGKIVATYSMNIYDLQGDKVCEPVLNILIEYFDSQTVLTITTKNENSSIAYLEQYMNYNGAILKVVERGVV